MLAATHKEKPWNSPPWQASQQGDSAGADPGVKRGPSDPISPPQKKALLSLAAKACDVSASCYTEVSDISDLLVTAWGKAGGCRKVCACVWGVLHETHKSFPLGPSYEL